MVRQALNEAGLGEGVVNVITHAPEDAPAIVERLIANPAVKRVNFTDSTRVGPMRARIISEVEPYVQDVVITGMNRDDVGAMIFPRLDTCRALAGLGSEATAQEVFNAPPVRELFSGVLARLNESATGSATFIARLRLLVQPPSLDRGEITDKGSINQRAVLQHRAELVEALYAEDSEGSGVIRARREVPARVL
ncbi:hypothetical protein LMG28688_05455 [Paraburkholderia caffeinitolerans]|uniref:Uncharacterized protein n=1 Tax=Paraburkholderia caffeinitolerans TaxID=1723730 RepID=A0A6J5GM50_9BURK|nr:hypothetical protein LMG28688_05455 [Paraburkholderia caffeinitolerans]